jgi:hypothetical protein
MDVAGCHSGFQACLPLCLVLIDGFNWNLNARRWWHALKAQGEWLAAILK